MGGTKRTCCNHLGTVFFGAFLIAIIRMAILCFEFVRNTIEKRCTCSWCAYPQKCFLACLGCILGCCNVCMNKLNKTAFVWSAIYSKNFCMSMVDGVDFILDNAASTVLVSALTTIVIFVAQVLCVIFSVSLYIYLFERQNTETVKDTGDNEEESEKLQHYLFAIILIIIAVYILSMLVFSVVETTIDTIFVCYIIDSQANVHTRKGNENMKKLHAQISKTYPVTSGQHAAIGTQQAMAGHNVQPAQHQGQYLQR